MTFFTCWCVARFPCGGFVFDLIYDIDYRRRTVGVWSGILCSIWESLVVLGDSEQLPFPSLGVHSGSACHGLGSLALACGFRINSVMCPKVKSLSQCLFIQCYRYSIINRYISVCERSPLINMFSNSFSTLRSSTSSIFIVFKFQL